MQWARTCLEVDIGCFPLAPPRLPHKAASAAPNANLQMATCMVKHVVIVRYVAFCLLAILVLHRTSHLAGRVSPMGRRLQRAIQQRVDAKPGMGAGSAENRHPP